MVIGRELGLKLHSRLVLSIFQIAIPLGIQHTADGAKRRTKEILETAPCLMIVEN